MCSGVSLCYAHVMVLTCLMVLTRVRKGVKKTFFLEDLSQMWVGGVADSQTRSKPLKKTNHPENRPFRPEFHLSFSQISQKRFLYLPLHMIADFSKPPNPSFE